MTCPICAAETDPAYRPFCSRRCADLDLARWLKGDYAIPAQSPDDAEDAIDALVQALAAEEMKPH